MMFLGFYFYNTHIHGTLDLLYINMLHNSEVPQSITTQTTHKMNDAS